MDEAIPRKALVEAAWDPEVRVWFVARSDIPGLVTEADTVERLREKLPVLVRDLLEDDPDAPPALELVLVARVTDRITLPA